ncbi:tRNA (adenosine(37)-N6)-threonylcarbamoyltransferase complex ATPase subunit type 1 TsaE [Candidatus Liberibacter sp.]|uniref:tRNA (adenosine(37)-N6)-threonylcarbamoyltransferase complex ATPase subunit type 1 TsaE n=1 Tax=Candidatus Liberibacter sp. TaxID=34022 RepID=UPI0015F7283F|nr:tRNA (adenosine(37)-N6)-threonylcarbamoyltransferase complex ATPase subunit type 1 TsaE [Candidatus Liberibacter sp.]MBA5724296.1 tRNA (adenosine(37)-N6)-threonylcarbamoyltransferase complex ATPase subunit type 1 TsaE [Candidatus Liberibacter sp.]
MFFLMQDSMTISLSCERDTIRLGNNIARILKLRDCISLSGDIGSGKSFLARSIIRFLTKNEKLEVLSPTFTLVQIYDAKIPIAHFDFYRLSGPQDFFEIGFDETLHEGICIVEWPERGEEFLPTHRIRIHLDQEGTGRTATISAKNSIIKSLKILVFAEK